MCLQKVNEHCLWVLYEVEIDIDSELPFISGLRQVPRKFSVTFVLFLFVIRMLPLLWGECVRVSGSYLD